MPRRQDFCEDLKHFPGPATAQIGLWPPFSGPCIIRRRLSAFGAMPGAYRAPVEIGGVEIVLAGNADQREKRIAPGIGQRRAHPMRRRGLADRRRPASPRQSIPRGCASTVVRLTMPAAWSIAVVCTVAISCWPGSCARCRARSIAAHSERCARPRRSIGRMVADQGFLRVGQLRLGLGQRSRQVAIDSLDRCMAALRLEEVEADGAGFRALGADAMADRLLGILRHQGS